MECHFPAVGLLPCPGSGLATEVNNIAVIGSNPPGEITPLHSLIRGEESGGIGLWRRDLYGVGWDLANKRRKRGWEPGMEECVFANGCLGEAVEKLICWDGGNGNEWFPRMDELPWYYGSPRT